MSQFNQVTLALLQEAAPGHVAVGPVNMALMQGIKKVFDPKGILNPGKVCHMV